MADGAAKPHRIVTLVYDRFWPFEFGIAVEVFGWSRPEILGIPWYDFKVAGPGGPVRSLGAFSLTPDHCYAIAAEADTLIVPAWREVDEIPPDDVLEAVRRAHKAGARIVSYCTGSFVLGHAGLLKGRRATTHWRYMQGFKQAFPDTKATEDVLYVDDGEIITSAGSSAALDASLHIIRTDFGSEIANRIARSLVTPPHREGSQAQYIEAPYQERAGQSVAVVLDWARERLDQVIEIGEMAAFSGMSERTFLRRFREGTGTTPLKWLRRERVLRAMSLLEKTQLPLSDVSHQCGFGSFETFRAAFREIAGITPHAYRKRFECGISRAGAPAD